mmetsp:Transcript_7033/g.20773  ORF Transcript_7033/g.20773 Transcript_7033/m.20773 type:complete len:109 (+) Transcript_7033:266-592(+)
MLLQMSPTCDVLESTFYYTNGKRRGRRGGKVQNQGECTVGKVVAYARELQPADPRAANHYADDSASADMSTSIIEPDDALRVAVMLASPTVSWSMSPFATTVCVAVAA